MSCLDVAGGLYYERCIWPDWNQFWGSGGRAALAAASLVDKVVLHTYASAEALHWYQLASKQYNVEVLAETASDNITFDYYHSLSTPVITPTPTLIKCLPPLEFKAQSAIRFGMIECPTIVHAERCVYDPQSSGASNAFDANGSTAAKLVIVANRKEILTLAGGPGEWESAARSLLTDKIPAVIVKADVGGAFVVERDRTVKVPAIQSANTFKIGSGDVFSAVFAAIWACRGADVVESARHASSAVAQYVDSMSLPVSDLDSLPCEPEAVFQPGQIYLAGPFFNVAQRWIVEEARRHLLEMDLQVLSPLHDVGVGPGEQVAPRDLDLIKSCDRVFAILDGLDSGTLFEIGYAHALGKRIYCLAQNCSESDLKMIHGSNCRIFSDFVTALYHVAWRT